MSLVLQSFRNFPSEIRVSSAEVTVSSGLLEDRSAQLKVANDGPRTEVEVILDDHSDLGVSLARSLHAGAIGVYEDGERVRDSDGVRQLDQAAVGKTGGNYGLGSPSGSVGSRTVDLRGVLSRESSSSVGSPASVSVNNDLAAGESSVAVRTTDNESTRGVQVVDGLLVEVLGRHHRLDHVLHEPLLDILLSDLLVVLGGDDDGVDTEGHWATVHHLVFTSDLSLPVGTHPGASAVLAHLSELGSKRGSKVVGERHEGLSLVGGVAEHDSLVPGARVLDLGGVHRLRDVRRLLLDSDDDIAGPVVEPFVDIIVANLLERITNDLLVVDGSSSSDLSEDHDHTSLRACL